MTLITNQISTIKIFIITRASICWKGSVRRCNRIIA